MGAGKRQPKEYWHCATPLQPREQPDAFSLEYTKTENNLPVNEKNILPGNTSASPGRTAGGPSTKRRQSYTAMAQTFI